MVKAPRGWRRETNEPIIFVDHRIVYLPQSSSGVKHLRRRLDKCFDLSSLRRCYERARQGMLEAEATEKKSGNTGVPPPPLKHNDTKGVRRGWSLRDPMAPG